MNKGRPEFYRRLYEAKRGLAGDMAECGVGKGKSLANLAPLAFRDGRRLYAFESWQEFPPLELPDRGGTATALTERLVVGDKLAVLERLGLFASCVEFRDGWLAQTLPGFRKALMFVNLDLDLYQPYCEALMFLWPLLVVGGVMVFDEYHEREKYPGALVAVNEFLADKPHLLHEDLRWWAEKIT